MSNLHPKSYLTGLINCCTLYSGSTQEIVADCCVFHFVTFLVWNRLSDSGNGEERTRKITKPTQVKIKRTGTKWESGVQSTKVHCKTLKKNYETKLLLCAAFCVPVNTSSARRLNSASVLKVSIILHPAFSSGFGPFPNSEIVDPVISMHVATRKFLPNAFDYSHPQYQLIHANNRCISFQNIYAELLQGL